MRSVLVVIGTRPEAVKMAPVIKALGKDCRVVLTGQHDEMVKEVLDTFGIQSDYDLNLPNHNLHQLGASCLLGVNRAIESCQPSAVLVQGDTASVAFGALAGFLAGVPVGHVEAGLRSGNRQAPWPEEVLRRVVTQVADWHFAPTAQAGINLLNEGIIKDVFVTGNTVVDAVEEAKSRPHEVVNPELRDILANPSFYGNLILMTMHRRENLGEPMKQAFSAIRWLMNALPFATVLYPMHPNPAVRQAAHAMLSDHPGIRLTEPLSYLDTVAALKHASLVLTDSGGLQEEAPSFGVPVAVLRDVTERPEAVEADFARLVGCDRRRIHTAATAALSGDWAPAGRVNPFGDGKAGQRIARIVLNSLQGVHNGSN